MLKTKKYLSFAFTVFICTCLLVGCSRTFVVKPSGSFTGPVRFDFYENKETGEPSKFKIVEFVVQKQLDNGSWVTSWELYGKKSLSSIEYGAEYNGLNVVVSPEPLEKGVHYRVLAAEVSATSPKGFSGSEFHFTDSGEMVVKEYK